MPAKRRKRPTRPPLQLRRLMARLRPGLWAAAALVLVLVTAWHLLGKLRREVWTYYTDADGSRIEAWEKKARAVLWEDPQPNPFAPAPPEPLRNLEHVLLERTSKRFLSFMARLRGAREPVTGTADLIDRLERLRDFTETYDYTELPRNSYIPFNPDPYFTGRKQDLLDVERLEA